MEKNRKNKVTQQIRKTNLVKSMPPQSYAKESQQQTLLWPLSSCELSVFCPQASLQKAALPFCLSRILPSWKSVPDSFQ